MHPTRRIRLSGDPQAVAWLTARLEQAGPDARVVEDGAYARGGTDVATVEVEVACLQCPESEVRGQLAQTAERNEILAAIASAARDSQELGTVVDTGIRILGPRLAARTVDVWLLDTGRNAFELTFQWCASERTPSMVGHVETLDSNGTFADLCLHRRPFAIRDRLDLDPAAPGSGSFAALGGAAIAGVPIQREGDLIGLFAVTWNEPREFPPDEILFLSRVADQLALAIRASRLYENLQRQVAALAVAHRKREEASRDRQQLSAMLVHDLKNPLSAILASLELFRERVAGDPDPRATRMLRNAIASARGLQGLIEDTLLVYRPSDAPEREPAWISAADVVSVQVEEARWLADTKHVAFETDFGTPLPRVRLDPSRYRRAVANLLGNALKFTPSGGRVRATMATEERGDATFLVFAVADTGPGLDSSERTMLATPYLRFPNADGVPGTGIGLTVVRMVAEQHGGQLEVRPNEGGGSVFRLLVPA